MNRFGNIRHHITSLVQKGLVSTLVGVSANANLPLSDLDFSRPVPQSFPETAESFAALVQAPAALPSSILLMEGTSGNLVDELGNVDLANQGPVALQGQRAVGFSNGVDMISKRAIETTSNSSRFEESDNTKYDVGLGSFAHTIVFRVRDGGLDQYLFRKRNSEGAYLRIRPNGDLWWFMVGATGNKLVQLPGIHNDGAWHVAICGYHEATNQTFAYSDLGSNLIDAGTLGSLSNTDFFTYCDTAKETQLAYAAFLEGAAAEALLELGVSGVTNFWTHGSSPVGPLVVQDRNSVVSVPVSADGSIGHYGRDTVAIGYSAAFTGPSKFGLVVNDAVENLVTESEDLFQWTDKLATVVSPLWGDAPDGFRGATKLRVTADNGYHGTIMATTASTQYTLSCYLKTADVGAVSGRLIFYDLTGGAEIASKVFTSTDGWIRETLTATSAIGQVSSSLRIELDTNTNSVQAWGAQCELGAYATFYVRSLLGVATTSVRSYYRGPWLTDNVVGEISSVSCKAAVRGNVAIWNCLSTGGNQNRRRVIANLTYNSSYVYAGDGVTEDSMNVVHGDTLGEEKIRLVWDQSTDGAATGGRESVTVYQGVTYNGSVSPWENVVGGAAVIVIDIGSIGGGFVQPGFYQSFKSYSGLGAPLP